MKCALPLLCATLIAPGIPALRAEIIVLKNGERLNARITHTSDTAIEVAVPVTPTISDTRTIPRADIASIEQPDPSLPVFDALKRQAIQPNSLASQDYDSLLRNKLIPFLAAHPQSPRLGDMQQLIATVTDEKQRVMRGETKIEFDWYDSRELEADREQVDATLAYQHIEAATNDPVQALNLFVRYQKKYPGAKTLPKAVDAALRRISLLRDTAAGSLRDLPGRLAARQAGWNLAAQPRRSELIAAGAREDQSGRDALAAAKKAGDLWMPFLPLNKESLESILRTAASETKRLQALPVANMNDSIKASLTGRTLLAAGKLDAASAHFQEAARLWPVSLMNRRNTQLLEAARAARAPTPTPRPTRKP